MNQFIDYQKSEDTQSMVVNTFNGHVGKVIDLDIGLNIMTSIGVDRNMIVWNLESKSKIDNIVLSSVPNVIRFSSDSLSVFIGCSDTKIYKYGLYGQEM